MHVVEMERILDNFIVIIDTREQQTKAYEARLKQIERECRRSKLNYGDYSCEYIDANGELQSMNKSIVIERKQSIDELCMCFAQDRKRFQKEFERAKEDNCKMHLIIEDATYEKIRHQKYESQLPSQALIASLLSWMRRYDIKVHFCKKETSGWLIKEILYYELREYLLNKSED